MPLLMQNQKGGGNTMIYGIPEQTNNTPQPNDSNGNLVIYLPDLIKNSGDAVVNMINAYSNLKTNTNSGGLVYYVPGTTQQTQSQQSNTMQIFAVGLMALAVVLSITNKKGK